MFVDGNRSVQREKILPEFNCRSKVHEEVKAALSIAQRCWPLKQEMLLIQSHRNEGRV